jgi:hypothetical protein
MSPPSPPPAAVTGSGSKGLSAVCVSSGRSSASGTIHAPPASRGTRTSVEDFSNTRGRKFEESGLSETPRNFSVGPPASVTERLKSSGSVGAEGFIGSPVW